MHCKDKDKDKNKDKNKKNTDPDSPHNSPHISLPKTTFDSFLKTFKSLRDSSTYYKDPCSVSVRDN